VRELFDVLSADGLLTGIVKDRDAVHRDGDWHRCGHVWIASGDRVLLQRRALVKESWPGLWDISVAGHVHAGESSIDAAIREAHEELGLDIAASDLHFLEMLRYQVVLRPGYVENELHDVYLLRRDVDLASLTLDPLEVAEVRWVALDDLTRYELVPHEDEYALLRRTIIAGL
jgi:isopentenyldiphosphate isomerase